MKKMIPVFVCFSLLSSLPLFTPPVTVIANESVAYDLQVTDGPTKNSKQIKWKGTQGVVSVEIKQGDRSIFKANTRFSYVLVSNLSSGSYELFINQQKVGSFEISGSTTGESPSNQLNDFQVKDGASKGSKIITWSGTSGIVLVEVKSGDKVVFTQNTRFTSVTVSRLSAGSYDVFINGMKAGSFTVELDSAGGSSQSKAQNIKISKKSQDSVQISWEGTTGKLLVQLRDKNSKILESAETDKKSITFHDLDPDKQYFVYINNEYVTNFTYDDLDDNKTQYKVTLTKVSGNGVKVSWSNTTGFVEVELKKGSRIIDADRTDRRSVVFQDLDPEEEYKIYLDGEFILRFSIDKIEEANKNKDVKNLRVRKDEEDGTIQISWKGTSGTVEVELKATGVNLGPKRTDIQKTTFYRVPLGKEYKLYIGGKYVDTISFGDVPEEIRDVNIVSGTSPVISWTGSTGEVKVELKQGTRTVYSQTTRNTKLVIEGVPAGTYTVYLNGKSMNKNVTVATLPTRTSKKDNSTVYSDVKEGYWAKEAIVRLTSMGILRGFNNGSFRPDQVVTREQLMQMIVQAKGLRASMNYSPFTDVIQTRWSTPAIIACIENAIVFPNEVGTHFFPEKPVTREEMAVFIARAQGLLPDNSPLSFQDAISIEKRELVQAAVKAQYLLGFPDGTFRPSEPLTRAQAAMVINKIVP